MRALTISIVLFCLALYSCQKGQGTLVLRLDTSVHNSNFPIDLSTREELRKQETLVLGQLGVHPVKTKSVDVDLPEARFRLTLIDMNQDLRFDEVGVDMIMLSPFGQDSVPINMGAQNLGLLRDRTLVQVDRSFFLLTNFHRLGETIEALPWERCPSNALTARIQTRMKQLRVSDAKGEDAYVDFRNTDGKSTLLLIWNRHSHSQEFLQALHDSQATWNANWQVVGISMNDTPQTLSSFTNSHDYEFPMYLMTAETCQVLDCHALPPYGIILDEEGYIIQKGTKWGGLWYWLRNEANQTASSGEFLEN